MGRRIKVRLTKLDKKKNQYYVSEKGLKIYGASSTKLAMYENIAEEPTQFANVIRTAQEILEGTAYTPKQAEQITSVIEAQAQQVAEAVLNGIIKELEPSYPKASEHIKEHYKD